MPRKADPSVVRVCLTLHAPDMERLKILYPVQGASAVVRTLIRAHLLKVDRAVQSLDEPLTPEIDLDISDLTEGEEL